MPRDAGTGPCCHGRRGVIGVSFALLACACSGEPVDTEPALQPTVFQPVDARPGQGAIAGTISRGQARGTDANAVAVRREQRRKLLLDTDPGGDDAIALLWLASLARQDLVEIVAVTTVGGNVDSEKTFVNAAKLLALAGVEDVEVGRAAVAREGEADATHIFGADGMGNLSRTLPAPEQSWNEARSADDVIIEKLGAAPGEITLVAIGPLTNLAAAEEKSPGILAKAREVVIMGGTFQWRGNITSHAEFNIHHDPGAARRVLASRHDLVMLPLDVTRRVIFTLELAREIGRVAPRSRRARFIIDLCEFLTQTNMRYRQTQGRHGFLVHDAATLAYLFYPETLLFQRAHVRVETRGEWTRGQTVTDERHGAKTVANAWVGENVEATILLVVLAEDLEWLIRSK